MKHFPSVFLALLIPSLSFAEEAKLSDLVKVNDQTKAKCVEYYTNQGVLYCSTKAYNSTPLPADVASYEKQNIVFDNRTWKLAWGKKTPDFTTTEYVPVSDDINDWQELITSQFVNQLPPNISPRFLAERIVNGLKQQGFDPMVTYHVVTPDRVIFEFRIDHPSSQVQDEIQMIRKEKDGVYILHYVIKKPDMGKEEREKWLNNISKSTIK